MQINGEDVFLMTVLVLAILLVLTITFVRAAEKLPCMEAPIVTNEQQAWRMIDGRKCWYVGPRMKPREDLYWPVAPPSAPLPVNVGELPAPPEWLAAPLRTEFQERWDALHDTPVAQNPHPLAQWRVFNHGR